MGLPENSRIPAFHENGDSYPREYQPHDHGCQRFDASMPVRMFIIGFFVRLVGGD